jgi:5-formyltetrahydrofolate cyclo-ligase
VRSQDLKKAKRTVRRAVLAVRDGLSTEERAAQAAAVTDRVLALPEMAGAQTVMAFSSFGSELPTTQLIEALDAAGVKVALPVIADGEIEAHAFRPGDPTTRTHFGALEPVVRDVPVPPTAIDVVVVPAVAFDRTGRRVGYGGGFYDRFLPRTRADTARVGVGLSVQLLDEPVPAGDFDLRVDVVVVPDEVIRCSR